MTISNQLTREARERGIPKQELSLLIGRWWDEQKRRLELRDQRPTPHPTDVWDHQRY